MDQNREKVSLLIALLAVGRSHYHGPGLFHKKEFVILAGSIKKKSSMYSSATGARLPRSGRITANPENERFA
jgi:hypothetical protein